MNVDSNLLVGVEMNSRPVIRHVEMTKGEIIKEAMPHVEMNKEVNRLREITLIKTDLNKDHLKTGEIIQDPISKLVVPIIPINREETDHNKTGRSKTGPNKGRHKTGVEITQGRRDLKTEKLKAINKIFKTPYSLRRFCFNNEKEIIIIALKNYLF
jgi:hypothetical protein